MSPEEADTAYQEALLMAVSAAGAVQFLRDSNLADGTTERRFMQMEAVVGAESFRAREVYHDAREADDAVLREAGR
jgi:predicted aminopeptidase